MAFVCWFLGVAAATLITPVHPYNTYRTPIYSKSCGYYDNPMFKLESRTGETQPIILIDNRLRKESSYDPSGNNFQLIDNSEGKYQAKTPLMYYPNMASIYHADFRGSEEESKPDYDNEKLWRVGEIPIPHDFKTLPDVYVGDSCNVGNQEDAPPSILDLMSVERSELTEESHDLGDLEIQETFLKDPSAEPAEIILETITTRPEPPSTENPALVMLKKKLDNKKGGQVDAIKREEKIVPVIEENVKIEDVAGLVTEKIEATTATIIQETTGEDLNEKSDEDGEDKITPSGSSLL